MGFYINPKQYSKEAWLAMYGKVVAPSLAGLSKDEALVCLVDNGLFTAAAVIYGQQEMCEFARPDDHRSKTWFVVPRQELFGVSDVRPQDFTY